MELNKFSYFSKLGTPKGQNVLLFATLGIIAIFYLAQNLFYVNGLNDFDEYFIRAELWVNGNWNWGGGTDKLLSFIEYLPLYFFQDDFMAFYRTTNMLIVILLLAATALFILKENEMFPSFTIKFFAAVFFLTMPDFIFKNLTIDASALLGIMLLFFLVSYRNRYMGWLGLLIYLSRPEGVIIILFYIYFLIFDKKHRLNILINLFTFIAFLIIYKYLIAKFVLGTVTITGMADVDNSMANYASKSYGGLFFDALKAVLYIPQYLFLFGMEILQNKIIFVFYLLGIIASLFNRKYLFFLVFIGGYAYMYMGLNKFSNPYEYSEAFEVFASKMEWLGQTIEIANGRNMAFNVYGHSRYRIFFYPAVGVIVMAGILFAIKITYTLLNNEKQTATNKAVGKLKKGPLKKKKNIENKQVKSKKFWDYLTIGTIPFKYLQVFVLVAIVFVVFNLITYNGFSKEYTYKSQMNDAYMNDYYKAGFEIRKKHKPQGLVFMPNICNCNRSFIGEFLIFSGTRYTLVPVCEDCNDHLVYGHPDNKQLIRADEIDSLIPSRNVIFDRYAVDYQRTFNDSTARRIRQLYQNFDLNMLDSLRIDFVITPQDLEKENLNMIKQVGEVKLYQNIY